MAPEADGTEEWEIAPEGFSYILYRSLQREVNIQVLVSASKIDRTTQKV
jgi:hypothetical protein